MLESFTEETSTSCSDNEILENEVKPASLKRLTTEASRVSETSDEVVTKKAAITEAASTEATITEAASSGATITEAAKEMAGAEDVSQDSACHDGIPDAAMNDFLACWSAEGMRTETAPRSESTTRKTKRLKRALGL